ncbi:hypothetical protein CK203_061088 [Vitis vinifera]|uniref:Uncharacterized protein n=1 Tax=Vitis vinifera TaxID=29760 RepID=A0A438G9W4_VITVI|nr:hypothetical protein CK203_061088 [Vitis vinifera]
MNQLRHQVGHESNGAAAGNESNGAACWDGATLHSQIASCACHIEYEIAEEAMNFMSYVAEFSREWGEPNARDMGRMTSQPNAKGEMYILNDGIDMKVKIAAMERRLEELEMQEVQAISQTPLQAMPCAIFHLSINNLLKHHRQASNLEQAMVNLNKIISKIQSQGLPTSNIVQEQENYPSQPYQNSKGIHEMEAKEGDKEVDLPTCKLEHEVESEAEKEKREEIKGKRKRKSTEKDDYINEEPQRIVIKEEMMKKTHASVFPQAFVWENHTEKVSTKGCKLHMGSGQA